MNHSCATNFWKSLHGYESMCLVEMYMLPTLFQWRRSLSQLCRSALAEMIANSRLGQGLRKETNPTGAEARGWAL